VTDASSLPADTQRIAALMAERESLRAERDREAQARLVAEQERDAFKKLFELVQLELERLKRQLFGQRAEVVDPRQVQLAFTPVLDALSRAQQGVHGANAEVEAELDKLRRRAREMAEGKPKPEKQRPHGRRDLSIEDLPVETIVLEPPERLAPGGEKLEKVGEEVAEHVDRRSASLVRVRVVRPKYKRPQTRPEPPEPAAPASAAPAPAPAARTVPVVAPSASPIVIAELPDRPIPRSSAGAGLLAFVLVQKFADHIPLHRQERIFRREGLRLPRSTLCGWVQGCAELLERIVQAMWEDARKTAPWIAIDATGVLVQAKIRCRRGHFWVLVAERSHVLFRYTKACDGESAAALLPGFKCYLIADASSVYHELYRREPGIIECGCWAHARRYLFEALSTDRQRALVGIGFIGLLYDAHWAATDRATGVTDGEKRRSLAKPILDRLYAWIAEQQPLLAKDAPIAGALQYLVNHRVPLSRFLDDGRLRLDNNLSELELRREAVGRHNWLFVGSDDGAKWNTTVVSLIASCQLHGIEPWAYLRDVLTLLPSWPVKRVLELAPKFWNETRQKPEAQQALASLRLLGRVVAPVGHDAGKNSAQA
jgi:transposase